MFIEANDDGGGGDNWTTGGISRAKPIVRWSPPTNQHSVFLPGEIPFLSPNRRVKALKGIATANKKYWL